MDVALATSRDLPVSDQDDQPLLDALARRGIAAGLVVWDDDDADWSAFRLVVVRSTWDYTARRDRFVAWAQSVADVTRLWNPAEVIRWNTHKGYLIELEERGAPVVPTAWLGRGDDIDLAALLHSRGWKRAVAKPAIGAGAEGLVVIDGDDPGAAAPHVDALLAAGDVMLQPYQRAIETLGELSIVVIDGEVSHAVRKRPGVGDHRVQIEHGGSYEVVDPTPAERDLAAWVLAASGHDYLYARVDLVPDDLGTPQLAELEVTEPSLYLTEVPGGADRLAAAIERRLD